MKNQNSLLSFSLLKKVSTKMIEARLKKLGIELPAPPPPAANYAPFVKVGPFVYVSGQLPIRKGEIQYVGKIGPEFTIEEGQEAARVCAYNILALLKVACEGDLNRVQRCIRLGGFVNCLDGFKDQPKVVNGASDLMVFIFGEKGRHARSSVGVNSLPLGSAVEIEALFEVQE